MCQISFETCATNGLGSKQFLIVGQLNTVWVFATQG